MIAVITCSTRCNIAMYSTKSAKFVTQPPCTQELKATNSANSSHARCCLMQNVHSIYPNEITAICRPALILWQELFCAWTFLQYLKTAVIHESADNLWIFCRSIFRHSNSQLASVTTHLDLISQPRSRKLPLHSRST